MSRLEELKAGLCPDGVEYKRLGDVADYVRGLTYDKYDVVPDGLPVLRANNINLSNTLNFDDIKHVSLTVKDYLYLRKNDILICAGSGSGEHVGKVAFISEDMNCSFGAFMGVVRMKNHDELLPGFMFHVLTSWRFRNYIDSAIHFSTIHNLNAKVMNDFTIPVPPLEVQAEIVRILDKFTSLTAELTAELTLRRLQYEYYRDKLLCLSILRGGGVVNNTDTSDDVKYLPLCQVLKLHNGKSYKHLGKGTFPVYGTGGIMTYVDSYIYDKPSVLIPRKGSLNKLYYVDVPFWNVDTIFYSEIFTDIADPKFIYYVLQSKHLENLNEAGAVPSLTQTTLNKILVPVPPIEQQIHIASILDRFDSLCNNLSHGLPAEIQARQSQYQYYRDKLLTFKEKSPCQNTAL